MWRENWDFHNLTKSYKLILVLISKYQRNNFFFIFFILNSRKNLNITLNGYNYQVYELQLYISRVLLTLGGGSARVYIILGLFYYIKLFWAPRRFLGAIKIATESWECLLFEPIFWSTGVDHLGNISIPLAIVYL